MSLQFFLAWPLDTWRVITDFVSDADLVSTTLAHCRLSRVSVRFHFVLLPLRHEIFHLADITWQHERDEEENDNIAYTMRQIDAYLYDDTDSDM